MVTPPEPLIELAGITKQFDVIQALRGVDLSLYAGEVHALVGVVLAIFIIAVLQDVLGLLNISGDIQSLAIGLLLILSVLGPNLARRIQAFLARRRLAVGSSKQL